MQPEGLGGPQPGLLTASAWSVKPTRFSLPNTVSQRRGASTRIGFWTGREDRRGGHRVASIGTTALGPKCSKGVFGGSAAEEQRNSRRTLLPTIRELYRGRGTFLPVPSTLRVTAPGPIRVLEGTEEPGRQRRILSSLDGPSGVLVVGYTMRASRPPW